MTHHSHRHRGIRGQLLAGLAALLWAISLGPAVPAAEPNHGDHHAPAPAMAATNALARLVEGNERFAAGKPRHGHESQDRRAELESQQRPFAVIVGCSDSRVPPELVFDQGFGDLFVVRLAGNIVDTDVTASVEYAVDHLGTPLVVVLGHTHCGAVTAAFDHFHESDADPDEIASLLYRIEPALLGLPRDKSREEQLDEAVRRNVALSVRRLSHVPDLMKALKRDKLKLVGAVYDLHTGKVELLKN